MKGSKNRCCYGSSRELVQLFWKTKAGLSMILGIKTSFCCNNVISNISKGLCESQKPPNLVGNYSKAPTYINIKHEAIRRGQSHNKFVDLLVHRPAAEKITWNYHWRRLLGALLSDIMSIFSKKPTAKGSSHIAGFLYS